MKKVLLAVICLGILFACSKSKKEPVAEKPALELSAEVTEAYTRDLSTDEDFVRCYWLDVQALAPRRDSLNGNEIEHFEELNERISSTTEFDELRDIFRS